MVTHNVEVFKRFIFLLTNSILEIYRNRGSFGTLANIRRNSQTIQDVDCRHTKSHNFNASRLPNCKIFDAGTEAAKSLVQFSQSKLQN